MASNWITGLLLLTLLLCVSHCEWNECRNVTLNSSTFFGRAQPSQHLSVKKSIKTLKYLGRHIRYYSNSTATFQISLTIYGDIELNPGPHPYISNHGNSDLQERPGSNPCNSNHDVEPTSACRFRQNFHYLHINDHPSSPSFYRASQPFRLDYNVWIQIHGLGISRKRKTHRGSKGRRRSNNTDLNLQTIPVLIRERNLVHISKRQIDKANLKSVKLLKANEYDLPCLFLSNVRSLNNKIDELEVVADDTKVDLIALTETWTDENTSPDYLAINGFTLFSKPRTGRRGGGVALYVNRSFNPHILPVIVPDEIEAIWVIMRPKLLPREISCIVICVLYFPPRNQFQNEYIWTHYLSN